MKSKPLQRKILATTTCALVLGAGVGSQAQTSTSPYDTDSSGDSSSNMGTPPDTTSGGTAEVWPSPSPTPDGFGATDSMSNTTSGDQGGSNTDSAVEGDPTAQPVSPFPESTPDGF